jgi:hypothetical protein
MSIFLDDDILHCLLCEAYLSTGNCNAVVPIQRKGDEFIIESLKSKLTSTLVFYYLFYSICYQPKATERRCRITRGLSCFFGQETKEKVKGVLSDRFVWLRIQGQGEGVHCNLGKTWRDLFKK